ncbi:TrmH family RNA methyltransferase [Cytobacillus sp. Hz8]|uniref:TrmH family RNA methyltransferase n=1 Tax=Cytobacillus sp. Hz8 TaxID=3347168 RepID=UPI0035DF28FF
MMHISSAKNPQVKQWKKLLTKKERDRSGLFLVEGFHLVEEALFANQIVEMIVHEEVELPVKWNYRDIPVTMVTDEVIRALAETETPQGIVAICEQQQVEPIHTKGKRFLLVDAVQDPGNLGTMIRTADAAGMDAIIVGDGSVDIYNPKVLRSAQGSHFHLPVVRGHLEEWIPQLLERQIPVFGTALEGAREYKEIQAASQFALLVGNEGNGVKKDFLKQTSTNLYIPIYGKSESLNVAVATGILLYYLRNEK